MHRSLSVTLLMMMPVLGCVQGPSVRHKPITAAERADCSAKGGRIEGVGMFGTPACVIPYADAGKVCSNDSDCLGECLYDLDGANPVPKVGDPLEGTCEATNNTFGCFTEVDDGKAKTAVCVD